MHHMPVRIQRLNRSRMSRALIGRLESLAKYIAERIALPIVMAFGGGVFTTLHFVDELPTEVACEGTVSTADRLIVAISAD